MNRLTIAMAAAVALNIWAAWAGRGSFVHYVAVFGGLFWIGLPLLLSGAVLFSVGRRRTAPRLRTGASWLLLAGLVVASSVISTVPGRRLASAEINAAQRHCEALLPELEAVKTKTGIYPASLPPGTGALPRLLEGHPFYWSDGTNYQFSFPDPTGIMGMFGFESGGRKWQRWD